MERRPVESTSVKSVGYAPETQTLEVELQTGGVYQYGEVPNEDYEEMMADNWVASYISELYFERTADYRQIKPGVSTNGRQPISSSMIKSLGYDPTTETLEAEFNSGAIWRYHDVPELIYNQLISSGSIGGYMRDFIIDQYPDTKLHGKR